MARAFYCPAWRTRVSLSLEDRLAIAELVSLHGHLVDDGSLERLDELFTADVVYDLTDFGQGRLVGVVAFRQAALDLGAANPVAHHVTNIVILPSRWTTGPRSGPRGWASRQTAPAVPSPMTTLPCARLMAGASAIARCRHGVLH
ncbi:nuclear transport factor 2 family protein [Streptomyces sp. NPDC060022]|uniref:nuclear transport factor 2 family protein n=1 Tax=Streptomyces sp. NPDC060022 TaxID=3347039 RepID=UPI00368B13C3